MKAVKILSVVALMFGLTGCASVFNPYHADFDCPNYEKGACVDMQTSYKSSLSGKLPPAKNAECPDCNKTTTGHADGKESSSANAIAGISAETSNLYQEALYSKLTTLLKAPMTPVVAPPKVMRVLFMPYRGEDNQLYMSRYVYMVVEPFQWVLSEMDVMEQGEGE